MMRSALVVLDGSAYTTAATTLALDWAARFGARVVGLGIVGDPSIQCPEPVLVGAGTLQDPRAATRTMTDSRRRFDFATDFWNRSQAAGVKADVLEDTGEPADRIVRHAQRCDVVVLGRETHFWGPGPDRPDTTLGLVLRHSPRPVVVVPRELPEGRGVVVAYGGGRESARTLQSFELLGLAAGEDVELLSINRDGAEAETFVHLAGAFLAAHEVRHELHPITSRTDPADVLLQYVRHRRPQLLVMGAHGHHPVRDVFVASVTRAVLRACPVPVFIGA